MLLYYLYICYKLVRYSHMKILIVTPLFPPDTGAPAPYTKQLLKHLNESGYSITLITYGKLPENAPYEKIIVLNKRWPKLFLLLASVFYVLREAKDNERIIVNNGPSSELPVLLASMFVFSPIILCLSDPIAKIRTRTGFYSLIHRLLTKRSAKIVDLPDEKKYLKPEKLPFNNESDRQKIIKEQTMWWREHISNLTDTI